MLPTFSETKEEDVLIADRVISQERGSGNRIITEVNPREFPILLQVANLNTLPIGLLRY